MGGKQRPIGVVILAILTDLAGILGLIVATVLGILAGEMEELIEEYEVGAVSGAGEWV